jgi:nitroreductase
LDVLTAIEKRREMTKFTHEPIPEELLQQLAKAAYLAPSGNNLPSREFVLITDREKLRVLSQTTPYMKWLEDAAAAIVIVGNQQLSKYWLLDASIAGGYIWLTTVSLGLGAAWGAVYHSEDERESAKREQFVRQHLGIPEHLRVVAIIGLGYPAVVPPPKEKYPLERVLHREKYEEKNDG